MVPSSFTIIGGGLTGTAMLYQFSQMLRAKALKNVLNPKGIYIQVIERQTVFGPGFPHNQSYMMPFHLINMCASDMGIVSGGPHDFETWVRNHPDRLSDPLPEDTPVCRHYPRTVMGAYLSARFQDAVRTARAMGITMDLYPNHEATDLV
ncbi:MAG: FAD/NAD(P)-binding protein, partial [Deltaproteobacteria bacterium]|nr:FAD/NAD(P)-binding protein [Deltaproteobacteria bacterium]